MSPKRNALLQPFFRMAFALLATLLSCRIFEYAAIARKSFVDHSYRYELGGLFYDFWLWMMYCFLAFWIYLLFARIKPGLGKFIFHLLNTLLLICYLGLLVTFSERNTPFDHELFTRNSEDTIITIRQMMTTGFLVYLPFIIYLGFYYLLYCKLMRKLNLPKNLIRSLGVISVLFVVFFRYANPSEGEFKQNIAYYLVCNKLTYWINDSYHYLSSVKKQANRILTKEEIKQEISFYQQNQPFAFTNSEFPLLHKNNDPDVLGSFFNLGPEPPNIVILVVEGLSRDFSGKNAYAGSFTPFLDSLSEKSLTWDNFLSTAPGTFAAHPAITGSLPYGKRGFSIMNIMPDHLSLIKILKSNGYRTSFMIGFNPDFDNMGGYIRLQGTDFILNKYGSEYKEMGVGEEGWSMGYPDDALYSRSFEVMDSLRQKPYLNIYHTATSHLPYLFEQKPIYNKRFDEKLKTMRVQPEIRRTLKETKHVLTTFMFADDCIRQFFKQYAKRPEFANTVFFITGDHHIGSFPAIGEIDDYHVPFLVYSPKLKKPQRFLSVNTHNNITPTILAMLSTKYSFANKPDEVHWLSGVMDTATGFRNRQSMPFMSWSREITDYIYKDYFISGDQLYKLQPGMRQEKIKNDSVLKHITALRENFKLINNFVCDSNKIFPAAKDILPGKKTLLFTYTDPVEKTIYSKLPDTSLMPFYKVPKGYQYLYVELSARVNIPDDKEDNYPTVRFAMIDTKNNNHHFLYWSKRDIATLSKTDFVPRAWNEISATDLFAMSDYIKIRDLNFDLAVYGAPAVINFKIQNLVLKVYGIK